MVKQTMSRNGIRLGILGGFYVPSAPSVEPDPSGGVLGPSLAGKGPKTDRNFNSDFSFLSRPLVIRSVIMVQLVPLCTVLVGLGGLLVQPVLVDGHAALPCPGSR